MTSEEYKTFKAIFIAFPKLEAFQYIKISIQCFAL